jgi:hypothetical protein
VREYLAVKNFYIYGNFSFLSLYLRLIFKISIQL